MIESGSVTMVRRVMVLAETASTQDAARSASMGGAGVLVVAGRQFAGRGRLGRVWADTSSMGVAATFAIEAGGLDDAMLSVSAGMAALWACQAVGARGVLGMRWPNDVVERGNAGRKVAGVLIERAGATALVGVGINVTHRDGDWAPALKRTAVSLSQLGIVANRLDVMEVLVVAFERALRMPQSEMLAAWREAETLVGTEQEFLWNGRAYRGVVKGIEPMHAVRVLLEDGTEHSLPALTTSMIHPLPASDGR